MSYVYDHEIIIMRAFSIVSVQYRVVELTLEIGLEIVVKVKVIWRVTDVRVLKNGGEEFECECEVPIIKWRYATFGA